MNTIIEHLTKSEPTKRGMSSLDKLSAIIDSMPSGPEACISCNGDNPWYGDGYCETCYPKSQQGIAEKNRRDSEIWKDSIESAHAILARIVSPEIRETDRNHPEFNASCYARVKQAWEGPEWMWFHSKLSGRSKTRIAYLYALHWIAQHGQQAIRWRETGCEPVVWLDGDRFSEACRLRHQFSLGQSIQSHAHDLIEAAKNCHLLVLDDLTKRKMATESVSDGFWEVIKLRHEWKRATIFTDNGPIEGLAEVLHDKHAPYIIRRLAERCIEFDFDNQAA
ncbi:hypothetical protein JIN85_18365 [Luteolibacter pohnpeiensis]|uniref:Uncharacterized protein n=1 Tax=Luteolibacter pohnpeiensis TaxID=454153 RepID=A0A934SFT6_9BACT|nr:hypothetical protein [Luteolibacter pohnpeiensis]MBK1884388.1 hypothetical protein [Luteolibacter pohnpeiensis]